MKTYQCPECDVTYTVAEPYERPPTCRLDGSRLVEQPPTLGISVAETIVTKDRAGDG